LKKFFCRDTQEFGFHKQKLGNRSFMLNSDYNKSEVVKLGDKGGEW